MKVAFELGLVIESLNLGMRMSIASLAASRRQRFALRGKVKKQRLVTHLTLMTKLPKRRQATLWDEADPLIVITLTRIGPGTLDSEDNLAAAFKAVRDGVASGLAVDDRHPLLRWLYAQERRGKEYAARVMIETMTKPEFIARMTALEEARP